MRTKIDSGQMHQFIQFAVYVPNLKALKSKIEKMFGNGGLKVNKKVLRYGP